MWLYKKIMPRALHQSALTKSFSIIGQFYTIWPLKSDATILSVLYYEIMWIVYLLIVIVTMLSSSFGIYCCNASLKELMKSITELTYYSESLLILIYFRGKKLRLKNLFAHIENFDRYSKPCNEVLNASLLTRIYLTHSIMPMTFIVGASFFIISPFFTQRASPLNAVYYTLPVETSWGWYITYLLNVLSMIQVSVVLFVDLMLVSLIWYGTYKFKLVKLSLQSNIQEGFSESTMLHQSAIKYAKDIDEILAPVVVKTILAVSIYMISCSLLVLYNVPLFELTQFFQITFFSALRLFLCCWPATALTEAAHDIGWDVYNTSWYNRSLKERQNILIIIQRCQKPIVIHVNAFVPGLSLKFYASTFFQVLYKIFSFFMTLRTILHV